LTFLANPRNMAGSFVKALNAKIRAKPTLSYFCSTRTFDTCFYLPSTQQSTLQSTLLDLRRATKLKRKIPWNLLCSVDFATCNKTLSEGQSGGSLS